MHDKYRDIPAVPVVHLPLFRRLHKSYLGGKFVMILFMGKIYRKTSNFIEKKTQLQIKFYIIIEIKMTQL